MNSLSTTVMNPTSNASGEYSSAQFGNSGGGNTAVCPDRPLLNMGFASMDYVYCIADVIHNIHGFN